MNIWASSQAIYCTLKMAVHTRLLVNNITHQFSSVQSFSRVRLFVTLWISMPGFPVYHQLPESTQTHVHRVGDAIQSSHPLSSPSPPAPNPSQHQGLFQWVNSSHEVAKVLEFHIRPYSAWMPWTLAVFLALRSIILGFQLWIAVIGNVVVIVWQFSWPF